VIFKANLGQSHLDTSQNADAGVIIVVLALPVLLARMNSEERELHEYFGAEYDAYRDRTVRLISWIYQVPALKLRLLWKRQLIK
jgi:hypothetical protein